MSKSSVLFLGLLALCMAMGKPVDPADEEISAEKVRQISIKKVSSKVIEV